MIAWNLATRGGDPFVNFKFHSFNVKCSQKLVNLGPSILFLQVWSKSYWHIVFCGFRKHSLLFLPLLFFYLGYWFGLPSIISCRNTYIEYGWTWCSCQYNDCLKFGNSSRDRFVQVKMPSLMSKVVKTWSIWETHVFPQSWSKSYPKLTQNLKHVQFAGFHTCFRYWKHRYFLWYLLWPCLCAPKFYPKYFYPKYYKFLLLSTPEGLKKCIFYVVDHEYIYIVCVYTSMYMYVYKYIYMSMYMLIDMYMSILLDMYMSRNGKHF